MAKFFTTPKGTQVPLTNLKGKDYLMVAYRILWFNESTDSYTIQTNTTHKTSDEATVQAIISIYNQEGRLIRSATARKTEERKSFGDFEEKAETGAIGRALAMLGYGTQFAIADLDEGDRIVDSPVVNTKAKEEEKAEAVETKEGPKSKGSFNNKKKTEAPTQAQVEDW